MDSPFPLGASGDGDDELAEHATLLANDELRRIALAESAWAHVERISDLNEIWRGWESLFRLLQ